MFHLYKDKKLEFFKADFMELFKKKRKDNAENHLRESLADETVFDTETTKKSTKIEQKKKTGKLNIQFKKGETKMPWRLIRFVFVLLVVVIFAAFNADNRCAVSLIFVSFKDVPVFVTMIASFCVGVFFVLPFTIGRDSAVRKAKEAAAEVEKLKSQKAMWTRPKKMPKNKHEKKSLFGIKTKNDKKSAFMAEKTEQYGNYSQIDDLSEK